MNFPVIAHSSKVGSDVSRLRVCLNLLWIINNLLQVKILRHFPANKDENVNIRVPHRLFERQCNGQQTVEEEGGMQAAVQSKGVACAVAVAAAGSPGVKTHRQWLSAEVAEAVVDGR